MRKSMVTLIFVILVAMAATVITFVRPKIARASLGIAAGEEKRCVAPTLPTYERPGYDRRTAANDYLGYAVAALNVYPDGSPKGFLLEKHSPEWRKVASNDASAKLGLDAYHKTDADRLTVLTVFRGTNNLDSADWLANLSWAVAWTPLATRYDAAREAFREVRAKAFAAAGGRKVSFIASGHSLGGGIAQHIAYSFPCTAAVVFNSSFVTNQYRLSEPYGSAMVVHVFEDLDELTRLRRLLFVDKETETYKHYRQDAVGDRIEFQHTMTGLAVGMARQVLRCQEKRTECTVPAADRRARNIYCGSGFGQGKPICKAGG